MSVQFFEWKFLFSLSGRTGGPNEASPLSPPSLASPSLSFASTRCELRPTNCKKLVGFGFCHEFEFVPQAGALVHIYTDGSVLLTHGGAEMGQGLHTKMIQVPELNNTDVPFTSSLFIILN